MKKYTPGEFIQRYRVKNVLGSGAFGTVYHCYDPECDRDVTIKLVSDTAGAAVSDDVRSEPRNLAEFAITVNKLPDSADVPLVYDVLHLGDDQTGIVCEYIPGVPLRDWIAKHEVAQEQACRIIRMLAQTIKAAHSHQPKLVHYDIKPENILIRSDESNQPRPVLIDWGSSLTALQTAEAGYDPVPRGTPLYMAPEILLAGRQYGNKPKADIFSLGVVFYELLTGHHPHEDRDKTGVPASEWQNESEEKRHQMVRAYYLVDEIDDTSIQPVIRAACLACLEYAPEKRPSASELLVRLSQKTNRHWWVIAAVCLIGVGTLWASSDIPNQAHSKFASSGEQSGRLSTGKERPTHENANLLKHNAPRQIGNEKDLIVGFLTPSIVYRENRPVLRLPDSPELRGSVYISRLTYFREHLIETGTSIAVIGKKKFAAPKVESIKAEIWAATDAAKPIKAVLLQSTHTSELRFAAPENLEDGVYCIHSGPLVAHHLPEFSAPFVIRGVAKPLVQRSMLEADDSNLIFRLTVKNIGAGSFNNWIAIVRLIDKDVGRSGTIAMPARTARTVTIQPNEEFEIVSKWKIADTQPGRYTLTCQITDRNHMSKGTQWFEKVESEEFVVSDNHEIAIHNRENTRQEQLPVRVRNNSLKIEETHILVGHQNKVWDVAFDPTGKLVFSASEDATIRWWDVETGREVGQFTKHKKPILTLELSPDGNRALSAGYDDDVLLWNIEDQAILKRFSGHMYKVWEAVFRPDHNQIITAAEDGTVKLWDVDSESVVDTWRLNDGPIFSIAVSHNGKFLVSGDIDGKVCCVDLESGEIIGESLLGSYIWDIAISPDDKYILAGEGGTIWRLECRDITKRVAVTSPNQWTMAVAYDATGERFLEGGGNSTVTIADANSPTYRPLFTYEGHTGDVLGLAVSPDNVHIASSDSDSIIRLWKLPKE